MKGKFTLKPCPHWGVRGTVTLTSLDQRKRALSMFAMLETGVR